ncbi:unnamed protein product [Adineta steineri]|uniref:Carbohydrate kinase PfkB domain-containing protein n=1 Tax=Adineta steineri TaxID=433720 RepID=A0A819JV64_9BILA|nr:unnamed protein product [Adineta steineri]
MVKHYHVYGVGAALVDTKIDVTDDDLEMMKIGKGRMTLVNETQRKQLLDYLTNHMIYAKRTSGGSTANSLIAINQFGDRTFYSCKVGNDDNGRFYLNDLKKAGVDYKLDKYEDKDITGTCLVMITPDAERTLCSFLGVNATQSENDIKPEIISVSDYVYFEAYMIMSQPTFNAAIRICDIAQLNNVKIAMSFSDAGILITFRDRLREILKKPIDLLFCNQYEALNWAETDNIDIAIDSLKKIAHTFAITFGADGALVYDGIQMHTIEPYKVHAIDTTGAGDMFAGAFLFGITQGKDFPTAGKLACLAAAAVVSNHGPRLTAEQQQEILQQWNSL